MSTLRARSTRSRRVGLGVASIGLPLVTAVIGLPRVINASSLNAIGLGLLALTLAVLSGTGLAFTALMRGESAALAYLGITINLTPLLYALVQVLQTNR